MALIVIGALASGTMSALALQSAGAAAMSPNRRAMSAALTIALAESGRLHPVSRGGNTIEEEGVATGTYKCAIAVHLVIVSTNRVTATFTVKPKGGTVSGKGTARLKTSGAYGYFGGTLAISKGTGAFAHASGNNIGISGKFNRETFNVTVNVHGTVHV